jgi:hypothetical protein
MTSDRCELTRRVLLEHAYDGLPADVAREVRSHLAECPACAARSAALRQGVAALDKLIDADAATAAPPAAMPTAALLQALSARHERQSRRWRAVAVCAAALAVIATVVACGRARIKASSSHLQITWGQPPRSPAAHPTPAPPPREHVAERDRLALAAALTQVEQLREQLAWQIRRLDELETLASLAGRQTLETDNRLTAAVDGLSRALHEHRSRTESDLADLRELGDIRWQLIHHEQHEREADLLTRAAHAAE